MHTIMHESCSMMHEVSLRDHYDQNGHTSWHKKRSWTFKNRKRKQLMKSVHFCSVEWKDDQKDKLNSWMSVYTSIYSDVLIKMTMKPWVKRLPDKFGDNRTSLFWIICFLYMNYWIGLSYEVLSSIDYRFYSIENGIKNFNLKF